MATGFSGAGASTVRANWSGYEQSDNAQAVVAAGPVRLEPGRERDPNAARARNGDFPE